MFTNYTVGVWNRVASTKVNGVTIPGALSLLKTISCDMQPYSQELLIKSYGYDIPVTKRFFIEDIADIAIGTILKYGTDSHEVKKIIAWDNYYDIMTLEVT